MQKLTSFFRFGWKPIYAELIFTALVFIPMILFSYLITGKIVHKYMVSRADNIVSFERMKIEADLMEPSTALGIFSETVQDMIANGDSSERIQQIFNKQSFYLNKKSEFSFSRYKGFYGYFETLQDGTGPVCVNGMGWHAVNGFVPFERPWYKAAIASRGEIGESYPYTDIITGEVIFTYARCIYDTQGLFAGIICLDVQISEIGKYIVDSSLAQGGYGILLSQDLTVLAHPYDLFIGMTVGDPRLSFSIYRNELENGEDIIERTMISFDDQESICFFKKLSNGWYLGTVTPKFPFYYDVIKMAVGLVFLGTLFAAALIFMLIRLDKARRKSVMESRYKSVFLANMSHEMRTPMNAIIGMSAIGKNSGDITRKDYCLSKIDEASKHLLGVINDILDMSKIEANKFELSNTAFEFEKMISQTINVVNMRIEEKNQKLTVFIDKAIPKILTGDDQRLAQVITNLLGNAYKFTDKKGSIRLNASLLHEDSENVTIEITVSDSGIGISPEQQEKLFKSFQQADADMTRKYGGTGLGLSICKNIVEMMGGRVWVRSEIGKGATFGFIVSLKKGEDKKKDTEYQKAEEINVPNDNFKGYRILLVEDMEINREVVIALLEKTEIEIDIAENGLAAVNTFSNNHEKFDLILMDLQMPLMDGLTATRQIRNLNTPNAKTIPIIAMTANVFSEDIKKCLQSGMNDHIGKPINIDEILEKLNHYLKN
ncbi:MAG: response regulator [Treponema sp.]|jgi:signal transduction histidine kinase/ActR/RegA family two-component response regulator|nr:response regulator [Treponema sp.]